MNLSQLKKLVRERLAKLDRRTLSSLTNDPFLLVSLISTRGGISFDSFTTFYSEGETIHNEARPQVLLSKALTITENMIRTLPFGSKNMRKVDSDSHAIGWQISQNEAVIITVVANKDDARWLCDWMQFINQS